MVSTCQVSVGESSALAAQFPYLRPRRLGVHQPGRHAGPSVCQPDRHLVAVLQGGEHSRVMNRLQRLIQERADERGWSLAHVATRSGLHRQTVYRLMREEPRDLPSPKTFSGLARGLELPERMLRDAAAESIGIRIYDEPVSDPDTKVVIATMEKLTPARRRAIRKMVEAMSEDYLGGSE